MDTLLDPASHLGQPILARGVRAHGEQLLGCLGRELEHRGEGALEAGFEP